MKQSLTIAALTLAGVLAAASTAFAADEYNVSAGLTATGSPLGLHGMDPVAFVDLGNRLEGTARHAAVHDGVTYYFTSEDNQGAFTADPTSYLPENGGFCTFGVSKGKKFNGDLRYAAVMDGKLFVFLNEEIFRAFQADRAGTIARAARTLPQIRHTAAGEL